MPIAPDGKRQRYFHERTQRENSQGSPVHAGVSAAARKRIVTEISYLAYSAQNRYGEWSSFLGEICTELRLIFPGHSHLARISEPAFSIVEHIPTTDIFLSAMEICINHIYRHRNSYDDLNRIQSLLADDFSLFRIRESSEKDEDTPLFIIQRVDNEHLQQEIVDRTFELTSNSRFQVAQRDYSEAWKHYSKGDFDDALVNAHKAFESAAKISIKAIDSNRNPDQLQTNQLISHLRDLHIIPSRLETIADNLTAIFRSAGTLRNAAGTGHGSLSLSGPEAS